MKVLLAAEITGKFYEENEDKDITFLEGEGEAKIYRVMPDDSYLTAYIVTTSRSKQVKVFEIKENAPAYEAYKEAYSYAMRALKV